MSSKGINVVFVNYKPCDGKRDHRGLPEEECYMPAFAIR
jgi:hypothetical protein